MDKAKRVGAQAKFEGEEGIHVGICKDRRG